MDSQTILNKIASLKRCVERIEDKIPKTSLELQSDYDLQDIVSLNLQRPVQVCVDIGSPPECRDVSQSSGKHGGKF